MRILVTVVIPVWRDTARLVTLLHALPRRPDVEIVVAATADELQEIEGAIACRPEARVVAGGRGRGAQMNAGARLAAGEWLLFLHADSQLPAAAIDEIAGLSDHPGCVGGSFQFALDAPGWRARLMEWGTARRTRWLRLPYGDQGIFVKRAVFEQLGGYREVTLMEDVEFVYRLRRVGRLHRSPLRVTTSARRWHRDGWFRRMGQNWLLMALYGAGVDPRRLARRYEGRRRSVVAMFARAPSSGGKVRLFESLGIAPDPALLTALVSDTAAAVGRVHDVDRALVYTPAGSREELESAASGRWESLAQSDGDLGERMAAAFRDLHALGYDEMVLIGSDVPTVPPACLARAVRALRSRTPTVVLGPAMDGGYYLIGLQRPADELFRGVAWSTEAVLEQTVARARALRLSVHLLDRWYDIDDVASLRRAVLESGPSQIRTWWQSHYGP